MLPREAGAVMAPGGAAGAGEGTEAKGARDSGAAFSHCAIRDD